MNEQVKHPERVLRAWATNAETLLWVLNESRGLNGQEMRALQRDFRVMNVWMATGRVPVTGTVKAGKNGQQATETAGKPATDVQPIQRDRGAPTIE